jgi:aspartate/methionine/tyrosine aminotransferase
VAFANIKNTGKSSTEIHQLLMDEARVAVVPGLPQWFGNGAEGYIRLSFATSAEVLNEACNRIEKVII